MTTALLVVDVQRDFCEGGALAVQGGNDVAAKLAAYVPAARKAGTYGLVIASKDWHAAPPHTNCGHFALEGAPDYATSWPVHCVAETEGASFHPSVASQRDKIDHVVRKGEGMQSYSAFEGVSDDGHSLLAILRSSGITDIDVCGIATDYCVKASVLDALGTGFWVTVMTGLIAGVDPKSSLAALELMEARGAEIC